jgi:hypothetical protein
MHGRALARCADGFKFNFRQTPNPPMPLSWHADCSGTRDVRIQAKTGDNQRNFDQGVWITPMVFAICGIAAALCAFALTQTLFLK